MSLIKCPRCELNYMNDNEEMCYELCASCLKELQRRTPSENGDEVIVHEDPNIGIDSMATMDEINLGGDVDDIPFEGAEEDFMDEDDEEEEEDEE